MAEAEEQTKAGHKQDVKGNCLCNFLFLRNICQMDLYSPAATSDFHSGVEKQQQLLFPDNENVIIESVFA